jgi:two-component system OmpR family sensor kinase
VPRGLRARLILAISLVTALVVGFSFIGLERGTGQDLQQRIDDSLRQDYAEFQSGADGITTPAGLERHAKRFINSQGYHPASRIFVIEVAGRREVTNQGQIVRREVEHEQSESGNGEQPEGGVQTGLIDAPLGLANGSTEETGRLRIYSHPVVADGKKLGVFRVAEPLASVESAQSGLRSSFLLVGLLALLFAVAAASLIATLLTRPLRRITRTASAVDAGDLKQRIEGVRGSNEAVVLAESFNHMLDRLEDAFGRQRAFVADASHELRTPLTVLRGEIELLERDRPEDEELTERAAQLLREIRRMERLVDDMLTLAGAESGALVHPRPVDLSEFFEDLRRDLPLLGPREYHVLPIQGTLDADPDRLAQVVRNLVRNAVAHTASDGRITVRAASSDGHVEFAVTDNGTGIPAEHLGRLFDRFYRTDAGRARDDGGSGLGLAIARAIVEAHGGRIWAESAPGQGATIRFELPGYGPRPAAARPPIA